MPSHGALSLFLVNLIPLVNSLLQVENRGSLWNVTVMDSLVSLEVHCPEGHWCGFGLNPLRPGMDGAELFTFGFHRDADLEEAHCARLLQIHGTGVVCSELAGDHCNTTGAPVSTSSTTTALNGSSGTDLCLELCNVSALQREFCLNGRTFWGGQGGLEPVSLAQSSAIGTRVTRHAIQELHNIEYTYSNGMFSARAMRPLVSGNPEDLVLDVNTFYYKLVAVGDSRGVRYHGQSDDRNLICASTLATNAECLPAGFWQSQDQNLDFNNSYFDAYEVVSEVDPHYRLGYSVNRSEEYVDIIIAAKTTGWLGLGFYNQTASHPMIRTDIVLGWVTSEGEAVIQDRYAFSIETPRLDEDLEGGRDQLLNKSGIEENGVTYLRFRRSYREADLDPWDYRFEGSMRDVPLVYAWGDEGQDAPEYHSSRRGYASMSFNNQCEDNWRYSIASSTCVPCEPGYFRLDGEPGFSATECQRCPLGTFATLPGDQRSGSACTPCGFAHAQTSFPGATSIEDCSCQEGYYHNCGRFVELACKMSDVNTSAEPVCSPCPAAMTCDGGLKWAQLGTQGLQAFHVQPTIDIGYFSRVGEYSAFRCLGEEERCPGGLPGACAKGREGLQCAKCEIGMEPGSKGKCTKCTTLGEVRTAVVMVFIGLGLVALYLLVVRESSLTPTNIALLAAIIGSQAVTSSQVLGAVSLFAVDWPEPLKGLFIILGTFSFDVSSVGVGCYLRMSGLKEYAFSVIFVCVLLTAMALIHVVYRLAGRVGKKAAPAADLATFPSSQSSLSGRRLFGRTISKGYRCSQLINVEGTLFMVLFISITTSVSAPFACNEHPNGLWTVRSFPTILCWGGEGSTEHSFMLILSIFASTLPLTFLALCTWLLLVLPKKIALGQMDFLQASAFLTLRFAPKRHYFGMVFLVRNLFISLLPTIPSAVVQLVVATFIMVFYNALISHWKPWRVKVANILDVTISITMVMALSMMSVLVEGANVEEIALVVFTFIIIIVALLLVALVNLSVRLFKKAMQKPYRFFLCHHKTGAGAFARLLKMTLLKSGSVQGVFIDSDNLANLHGLFDHLRHETKELVLLCTSQLFYRPWCVGEAVTGLDCGLMMTKVEFPDAPKIDPAYIENWKANMQDWAVLSEAGMSLEVALRMLQRVGSDSFPRIRLPEDFVVGNAVLGSLVKKLVAHDCSSVEAPMPEEVAEELQTAIVVDTCNRESVATAYIIEHLLRPHYLHVPDEMPAVLAVGQQLPGFVKAILLVCTQDIFSNEDVLHDCKTMYEASMKVLPVVCDSAFQYPTAEALRGLDSIQHVCKHNGHLVDALVALIETIFKEIAVKLNSHASQKDLDEVVKVIHTRLSSNVLRSCRHSSASSWTMSLNERRPTTPRCAQGMPGMNYSAPGASSKERAQQMQPATSPASTAEATNGQTTPGLPSTPLVPGGPSWTRVPPTNTISEMCDMVTKMEAAGGSEGNVIPVIISVDQENPSWVMGV
mmetsp:Transcript_38577/g.89057  ORF Transcript_38577/g.89057 Transcript_38577/m.89057 type:complete len:1484 (+) Transcript_38577:69-4520(+)